MYVDNNGADTTDCGSDTKPCKNIEYNNIWNTLTGTTDFRIIIKNTATLTKELIIIN
jgi:hypothetical protein